MVLDQLSNKIEFLTISAITMARYIAVHGIDCQTDEQYACPVQLAAYGAFTIFCLPKKFSLHQTFVHKYILAAITEVLLQMELGVRNRTIRDNIFRTAYIKYRKQHSNGSTVKHFYLFFFLISSKCFIYIMRAFPV